ncbi:SAM-dependent methyltransferase [Moraxella sp. ZY210820]|uniref:class I SAM-dependent methyltransferase n=1 Tax=unclassified Moraxella TaxID=2685852 RepID=UPI002731E4AB|nr:SAM-dependent methyltransferase [Moraxella sp. ZY210820]WLF83424.1 SAM-dependent methyltransferase [Moraxella sp. ZY210820]
MSSEITQFLDKIQHAIEQKTFQRLILSQYSGEQADLQKISWRFIDIQQETLLSAVYDFGTHQQTKNYAITDALTEIECLSNDCKQANLFTLEQETQLKKGKKSNLLSTKKIKQQIAISTQHNREKRRYIEQNSAFLQHLGISDTQGNIIPAMSKKWKQINKFIEVLSTVLPQKQDLHLVDFGCGKGYLTFALYDYLVQQGKQPSMVGVELRPHLVEFCQKTADELGYQQLSFYAGDVRSYQPERLDVMIALHACDVATDFAIHTGIRLNAELIVCSPCCHKELRPQLHSPEILQPMLQFGIHAGQQAEMLTDTLRALFLQAYGYETKVFEFVALEHTSKNKMILAVKKPNFKTVDEKILQQIADLKQMYGIKTQMLETLLAE